MKKYETLERLLKKNTQERADMDARLMTSLETIKRRTGVENYSTIEEVLQRMNRDAGERLWLEKEAENLKNQIIMLKEDENGH